MAGKSEGIYRQVHQIVRLIPRGKVATYGQIADLVEHCTPRMAGYAMAAVPARSGIPWQRVVNARGEISPRAHGTGDQRQRWLLEEEGVVFNERGRIDLKKYRWRE